MTKQKVNIKAGSYLTFDDIRLDAGQNTELTVMFWPTRADIANSQACLLTHPTDSYPLRFFLIGGQWLVDQANTNYILSTGTSYTGSENICVTFSDPAGEFYNGDRTARLYINGVLDKEVTTFARKLVLGGINGRGGSASTIDCDIDEVKIWSRVLTDAEVALNYNTRLNLSALPSDLLKYFTFDTDNGASGYENHVTGLDEISFINITADPVFEAETHPIIDLRIDSVNGGNPLKTGDTAIVIAGDGMDTVTSITIDGETQVINAGATAASLDFDLSQNSYTYGSFDLVISDGTNSLTIVVSVEPVSGKDYVIVGAFIEPDTDERVVTSPDLQAGWVIMWQSVSGLTILSSGALEYAGVATQITFSVEVFDSSVWSDPVVYTITRLDAGDAPSIGLGGDVLSLVGNGIIRDIISDI